MPLCLKVMGEAMVTGMAGERLGGLAGEGEG